MHLGKKTQGLKGQALCTGPLPLENQLDGPQVCTALPRNITSMARVQFKSKNPKQQALGVYDLKY